MSALRILRQLTGISSRAIESRSSITRCRLPAFSARAFLAPSSRAAFSVSARRFGEGTTDVALSLKISDELQFEKGVSLEESEPEFLKNFKALGIWKIEDTLGHDEVSFTRKFGNENIRMMFSISDVQSLDEEDEFEEGAGATAGAGASEGEGENAEAEENAMSSYPIRVSFSLSKTTGPGVLNVDTACQQGAFVIDNLSYYADAKMGTELTAEADWLRRGLYIGPQFDTLDVGLQEVFEKFLHERGINESLALFVSDYAEYKEQKEYVNWLKNVKGFVDL